MDVRELQQKLIDMGYDPGPVDGDHGPLTSAAIEEFLRDSGVKGYELWSEARLEIAAVQQLLHLAGFDPGPVDGLMGPMTQYALEQWRADLGQPGEGTVPVPAPPLQKNVWPTQAQVPTYYGEKGKNQQMLYPPYKLWYGDTLITRISVHTKVHASCVRIFDAILKAYPSEAQRADTGISKFSGCLNVRRMTGGTAWSMHSWGIAFDFDAARNGYSWKKDKARLAKPDCIPFWEIWEAEGWVSLGREKDFDWMHIQAARL